MVLNKCCFCCKLETGGTVLGFLAAAVSFIWFILSTIALCSVTNTSFHAPLGITVAISVIDLAVSIVLIIGISKRERNYLIPWMVINIIALIPLTPFAVAAFLICFPIGFPFYLFYCVYSLFHSIPPKDDNNHIETIEALPPYREMDK